MLSASLCGSGPFGRGALPLGGRRLSDGRIRDEVALLSAFAGPVVDSLGDLVANFFGRLALPTPALLSSEIS